MSDPLDWHFVEHVTGGRRGKFICTCPLCSHTRKKKHVKCFALWCEEQDFATYSCSHCNASGWIKPGTHSASANPLPKVSVVRIGMNPDGDQRRKAQYLFGSSRPAAGTVAERYLRSRGYQGPIHSAIRSLEGNDKYPPAMLCAFGMAEEVECGRYALSPSEVHGVHITSLKPDGSGKAGTERDKIMLGPSMGFPLMLVPPNDGLGLIISEGIEDGLSAYEATGLGLWVAGSANRMAALGALVPSYIESVTIVADDDAPGRKGARGLVAALAGHGCEVRCTVSLAEEAA